MPRILLTGLGAAGLVPDLPPHRLAPNAFSFGENISFDVEGAKSLGSSRQVMTPVTGLPAGMTQFCWLSPFPPSNNPKWVVASLGTDKRIGFITESGGVYVGEDITRVSGQYNNISTQRWHGFVFQGLGYFNQEKDIPQIWSPIASGQKLIDMPNWSSNFEGAFSRARILRPHKNFLISLYITNSNTSDFYPYRIRWSDAVSPGQPPPADAWNTASTTNLAGEVDLAETSDYLVEGLTLGEVFIIYKERSMWGMQFIGGSSVMRFWRISSEIGVLYRTCASQFPNGHFVVTKDDIIIHNGTLGSVQSVVENRIRDYIFDSINTTNFFNCFNIVVPREQEIWFCFPTGGSTFATKAFVWHWDTNVGGLRDLPNVPFGVNGSVATLGPSDAWG